MLTYIIYRVEHKETGIGPYRNHGHIIKNHMYMVWAHEDSEHPSPSEDDLQIDSSYYFGFTSLMDLKRWFKGWLTLLYKSGYKVVEYKCPANQVKVGVSKTQCIFKK